MVFDFSEFFRRYEAIVAEVNSAFSRVQQAHPEQVACKVGCSDCCHAMFDLTFIEALYLNDAFNKTYSGARRSQIMERADKADREAYKFKHKIFKASQEGKTASEIMEEVARMRIRCPLLNEDETCALYEQRPVTCRVYGAPMAIAGQGHTCGKSGFTPGQPYPTVNMDRLQDRLLALSLELITSMPTKHGDLADSLVPVSMALLTKYDKEYLGLVEPKKPEKGCSGGGEWEFGVGGKKSDGCASCSDKDGCTLPQKNLG
jgi:Fe-S-cluster containining protein